MRRSEGRRRLRSPLVTRDRVVKSGIEVGVKEGDCGRDRRGFGAGFAYCSRLCPRVTCGANGVNS